MRRRDEPKLDDLKRILRRLENIEVEPGLGRDSADGASPPSGYVGALRGAPVGAFESQEQEGYGGESSAYSYAADPPARAGGKSGMASIVIGAATAAIVSSLAIVVLLLWTGGQTGKSTPDMRVPASIPKQPTLGAPSPASIYSSPAGLPRPAQADDGGAGTPGSAPSSNQASQASSLAAADADALVKRADLMMQGGNLADARQALENAAGLGSAVAALKLGATYDPVRTAEFSRLGARADPTLARAWYERAKALGALEATARLTELAKR